MSSDSDPFLGQDCSNATMSGARSRSAPSFLASSEVRLFSPRQAEVIYTGERPTCAAICSQVRPFLLLASRISSMAADGEVVIDRWSGLDGLIQESQVHAMGTSGRNDRSQMTNSSLMVSHKPRKICDLFPRLRDNLSFRRYHAFKHLLRLRKVQCMA